MFWIAAVCGLFALAGAFLVPAYEERHRVAELSAVRAQVFTEPRGQYLLRQFAGDSLSKRAVYVHLDDSRVTDEWLANLQGLHYVEVFSIKSDNVTDLGLAQLKCLPTLQSLHLVNTKTTEAGIRSLQASLPPLRRVTRDDIVNGKREPPLNDATPPNTTVFPLAIS